MKHSNTTREKILDTAFEEVYKRGYSGASINKILEEAGVPKGSLYHFFPSKKELVLAVIKERIIPKIDRFFDFTIHPEENTIETLERVFQKMTIHEFLIKNGCPLHKLIVEIAPLDKTFENILNDQFQKIVTDLSRLLKQGIEKEELKPFDTSSMARFLVTSTWGELSLPPSQSSVESFKKHVQHLLTILQNYKTTN